MAIMKESEKKKSECMVASQENRPTWRLQIGDTKIKHMQ